MWTISKARNRKGFTLIELMIVIAIIIILAAIAIPNYLKMTERAKKARVASDFESLATALESYRTDWGSYPVASTAVKVNDSTAVLYQELTGTGTSSTATNVSTNTTATGEKGGIEYIKPATLDSMVNPFFPTDSYYYGSSDGTAWVLYCGYKGTVGSYTDYLYRTDSTTQLQESATAPTIP